MVATVASLRADTLALPEKQVQRQHLRGRLRVVRGARLIAELRDARLRA